jgi:hypothetical protein
MDTRIENEVNMDLRFIDGIEVNVTWINGSEQTGRIDAVYPLFIVFIGADGTVNLIPWTSIRHIIVLPEKVE